MDTIIANASGFDQSIDWVPLSLTFVEYPKGKYILLNASVPIHSFNVVLRVRHKINYYVGTRCLLFFVFGYSDDCMSKF